MRPWGLQQSVKNPDGLGSGLTGVDGILLLSYLFGGGSEAGAAGGHVNAVSREASLVS